MLPYTAESHAWMFSKVLSGFHLSTIDNKANIVDACDEAGFFHQGEANGTDMQKGSSRSFEDSYKLYSVRDGGPNEPYIHFVVNEIISALVKRLASVWKDSHDIMQDAIQEEEKLVGQVSAYFSMGKAAHYVGKQNKALLKACETFIANGRKT